MYRIHISKTLFQENRNFIKQSGRCKNIMTQAKIQPFCRQRNLNLGVYNVKQKTILPRSVTQRNICLYIHDNHFCVIRKINQSTFPDAIRELKDDFKYESNELSDVILKQVIEYKFPISYEKNCIFAVFAFDLETCNLKNQPYCEEYAASVYHLNRLYECFNGDLTEKELKIERENVHVFDRENNNPVLDMVSYVINNYKGKPEIITYKHGKKILSSYKFNLLDTTRVVLIIILY